MLIAMLVWLNEFDAVSPWTIGRYKTDREADDFANTKMKGDVELIKRRNNDTGRKVDYIPVVLPGGSVSISMSMHAREEVLFISCFLGIQPVGREMGFQ
jgi:hypothetical protein